MRYVPRRRGNLRPGAASPILTKTRWLLLKRPEHLTEKQEVQLADLLRYNLRTVRSYLPKEDYLGPFNLCANFPSKYFCTCLRFSAWSNIMEFGWLIASAVISCPL
jgi:hypothetical protein